MDRIRHPPSRKLMTFWFIAIIGLWMLASTSDYQEARKMECANRSSVKYHVEWDSKTDTCRKEKRSGITANNR